MAETSPNIAPRPIEIARHPHTGLNRWRNISGFVHRPFAQRHTQGNEQQRGENQPKPPNLSPLAEKFLANGASNLRARLETKGIDPGTASGADEIYAYADYESKGFTRDFIKSVKKGKVRLPTGKIIRLSNADKEPLLDKLQENPDLLLNLAKQEPEETSTEASQEQVSDKPDNPSRRLFMQKVGAATAAAGIAATLGTARSAEASPTEQPPSPRQDYKNKIEKLFYDTRVNGASYVSPNTEIVPNKIYIKGHFSDFLKWRRDTRIIDLTDSTGNAILPDDRKGWTFIDRKSDEYRIFTTADLTDPILRQRLEQLGFKVTPTNKPDFNWNKTLSEAPGGTEIDMGQYKFHIFPGGSVGINNSAPITYSNVRGEVFFIDVAKLTPPLITGLMKDGWRRDGEKLLAPQGYELSLDEITPDPIKTTDTGIEFDELLKRLNRKQIDRKSWEHWKNIAENMTMEQYVKGGAVIGALYALLIRRRGFRGGIVGGITGAAGGAVAGVASAHPGGDWGVGAGEALGLLIGSGLAGWAGREIAGRASVPAGRAWRGGRRRGRGVARAAGGLARSNPIETMGVIGGAAVGGFIGKEIGGVPQALELGAGGGLVGGAAAGVLRNMRRGEEREEEREEPDHPPEKYEDLGE